MLNKKLFMHFLIVLLITTGLSSAWHLYQYNQVTHQPTIVKGEVSETDQVAIKLIISVYFLLSTLLVLLGLMYAHNSRYWWVTSYAISLCACIALILMWRIAHYQGTLPYDHYILLKSEESLEKALAQYGQQRAHIPTGIFIEHISFLSAGGDFYPGMSISGYVWQRYNLKEHAGIKRGFFFGDAGKVEVMQELDRVNTETEEIICWQFSALIRQRFNVAKFPFDHRHAIIQIVHPEFAQNVVLVPDFKSYQDKISHDRIGHSKVLDSAHWHTDKAFFSFHIYSYDENFGNNTFKTENFPQLAYYFILERDIIDTVIIYVVMLLVTAVILFITLLAFLKRRRLVGLLGFSTLSAIGIGSGLLFVLISTHNEIRNNLGIDSTAYIEYIFAIMYIVIIAISINSIMFILREKETEEVKGSSLLPYGDNFLIKIAYWPTLLTCILLVTAYTFYT